MELVLGLRLHSLILAATTGTPIVGIDYDPKIKGFMEQAEAEDCLTGVMDPPETLTRQIADALDNHTTIKRRLVKNCEKIKTLINREARRIPEIINRDHNTPGISKTIQP
jgi:polysaccharide pyruvyl transferase WcaK-like protein